MQKRLGDGDGGGGDEGTFADWTQAPPTTGGSSKPVTTLLSPQKPPIFSPQHWPRNELSHTRLLNSRWPLTALCSSVRWPFLTQRWELKFGEGMRINGRDFDAMFHLPNNIDQILPHPLNRDVVHVCRVTLPVPVAKPCAPRALSLWLETKSFKLSSWCQWRFWRNCRKHEPKGCWYSVQIQTRRCSSTCVLVTVQV